MSLSLFLIKLPAFKKQMFSSCKIFKKIYFEECSLGRDFLEISKKSRGGGGMPPRVLTLNCEGEKSEYVTYNLEYMLSDVTN